MDVLYSLQEAGAYRRPSVVALGMFDGVHRGHRRLLERAADLARNLSLPSVAMTFDRHPQTVLRLGPAPPLLTTNGEKVELMKGIGLDAVFFCPFDEELSRMSPEDFADNIVGRLLGAHTAVVGFNYSFGRGGAGDPKLLADLGERLGFAVVAIDPETEGNEIVASSLIRERLLAGDVERANAMLGRPYSLAGRVIRGEGRGRTLGFPTANLEVPDLKAWPADGVYACRCRTPAGLWEGVASIGAKPTFGGRRRTVEAFLYDFHGSLYGETLEVFFIERLRGIMVFTGPRELARQIARDVERARGRLQKV